MTLTLELNDNKEAALEARARAHGVSAEQFVQQMIDRELEKQEPPSPAPPRCGFLSALPKLWPMSRLRNSPSSRRTVRVRWTTTFTVCRREIRCGRFSIPIMIVTAFDLSHQRPPLVTTEEVLTEFLTFFSGRGPVFRRKAAAVAYALRDDPDVRLLAQTSESFSAGLRLYAERPDKEYSLTDCISIATMLAKGMTDSATGDRHFEQEGCVRCFAKPSSMA
jgi:predicted nucleic acid-binding protein